MLTPACIPLWLLLFFCVSLLQVSKEEAESMHVLYSDIIERIAQRPRNEAELLAVKSYIKQSEATALQLEALTSTIHERMAECGKYAYPTPGEEFKLFWSLRERPLQLANAIRDSLDALDADRARMIKALEDQKIAFERELEALEIKTANFKDMAYDPATQPDALTKIVQRANDIDSELRAAQERADDFNVREKSFSFPPTQYGVLHTIQEGFEPFYK